MFKDKKIFIVIIFTLLLVLLSGCIGKMDEEEYKNFTRLSKEKVKAILEITINEIKENTSMESREKIQQEATKQKEELIKELNKNKMKVPSDNRQEFQEAIKTLDEELDKLIEYAVIRDIGVLNDRNESLGKISKATGIYFKKEAYNVKEWFDMTVKEMRPDNKGIEKEPTIEELQEIGTVVWGYANLNSGLDPLITNSYLNTSINVSKSKEGPDYMNILNWHGIMNNMDGRELYEVLLKEKDVPVVMYLYDTSDIEEQIFPNVGGIMEYRYTLDYN